VNLQLDHFSDQQNLYDGGEIPSGVFPPQQNQKQTYKTLPLNFSDPSNRSGVVDNGSHNVSRWMTWLPISLKNAAKCDKWYQLQNLVYRIFERKWRLASISSRDIPPGMPYSQCRTKTIQEKDSSLGFPQNKSGELVAAFVLISVSA
jgi:hypothetical protein